MANGIGNTAAVSKPLRFSFGEYDGWMRRGRPHSTFICAVRLVWTYRREEFGPITRLNMGSPALDLIILISIGENLV